MPRRDRHFIRKKIFNGEFQGNHIIIHQPSPALLRRWAGRVERSWLGPKRHRLHVTRIDVAADVLTASERQARSAWARATRELLLRRCRGPFDGAIVGETFYARPRSARRNLVMYPDLSSKVTGDDCLHVELRSKAQAARRTFGSDLEALIGLSPKAIFAKFIKDRTGLLAAVPDSLSWPG